MPRLHVLVLIALSTAFACRQQADGEVVDISAFDLHRAFRTDPDSARHEFDGKDLRITGEVANAVTRFRGMTMQGEVEMPPRVMFRTELDTLPTDIKYVEVEGNFDVPDSLTMWALDPRIQVGEELRVSCERAEIRWSDPGLYISDCRIASD